MDEFLEMLLWSLGLLLLLAPIFSLLSYLRMRAVEKRLALMDERLSDSEERVFRLMAAARVRAKSEDAEPESWPPPQGQPEEPKAQDLPSTSPPEAKQPAAARRALPKAQDSPPAIPKTGAPKSPKLASKIQWEQWVGVRGAAVVGGVLLALAGLLFFQHALEQGWITPRSRVISGTLTGLVALVLSEWLRRRAYRFAPAGMAGGGVVVLYATTWAAYRMYGFLPGGVALPLMALITVVCGLFSLRMGSQFVAILGLAGGFATPLLLSLPAQNPLALLGYILLLDLGLLILAQRSKAPLLALLGVVGTFLLQSFWIVGHLKAEHYPLALISMGVFALIFCVGGLRNSAQERSRWLATQVGALLSPFLFTIYFGSFLDLGQSLWPLACLAGLLSIAATWIEARQGTRWLGVGAAAATLSLVAAWLLRSEITDVVLWEFCASSLGLALVFLLSDHWFGDSGSKPKSNSKGLRFGMREAPALLCVGFLLLLILTALGSRATNPWPWLVASMGHALSLHYQGRRDSAGPLRLLAALLAAITLGLHLWKSASAGSELAGGPLPLVAWAFTGAILFLLLGVLSSRREAVPAALWSWRAATCFPVMMLLLLPRDGELMGNSGALAFGVGFGFAVLASAPALLRGWSAWSLVVALLYVLKRTDWILFSDLGKSYRLQEAHLWLELAGMTLLAGSPLLARKTIALRSEAWAASALLLLLFLPGMDHLARSGYGFSAGWQAPLLIASSAALLGSLARKSLFADQSPRDTAARWLFGVAAIYGCLSLARWIGHDAFVLSTSAGALCLAGLWRRWPHLLLKIATAALMGLSALALIYYVAAGFSGKAIFESGPYLVWNWSSYVSGVPALCALVCCWLFASHEAERPSVGESKSQGLARKWASTLFALDTIFFSFLWLNLQVLNYYESTAYLQLDVRSMPARDLTLSIAWILFALFLLAIGMAKSVSTLRQLSLAFLLLTLVKVFMHDLGDLEGLYRVGSLMGLAVSLLLVSLLYQRFVFPSAKAKKTAEEESTLSTPEP